jgi:hypothetical protein
MMLGPTANLKSNATGSVDKAEIVSQLLSLVDATGIGSWPTTFAFVNGSGGTIHVRQQVFGFMSDAEQTNFARATNKLGLGVSIEAGGALCGAQSGTKRAAATLKLLNPFLGAGGKFALVALESIFSRTYAGCKSQLQAHTANEIADFAAGLTKGFKQQPMFFLYDALPHMSVGTWPRNAPNYDLDLGTLLSLLQPAMDKQKVKLSGYYLDCPYEYSRDYPNATSPMPAGSGFKKIAAAVKLVKGMGLQVGKTFNSQQGGVVSDELFYHNTLADWKGAADAGASFDFVVLSPAYTHTLIHSYSYTHTHPHPTHKMVESWYFHPLHAAPEDSDFTTTNTAKAVFAQAARSNSQ